MIRKKLVYLGLAIFFWNTDFRNSCSVTLNLSLLSNIGSIEGQFFQKSLDWNIPRMQNATQNERHFYIII
jgi:hypothetical protein